MKKGKWILIGILIASAAMAEQFTLVGTLEIAKTKKHYRLSGSTPEMASSFKVAKLAHLDLEPFSSGDQVKIVLDGSLREDGKISPGASSVISIEKVQ